MHMSQPAPADHRRRSVQTLDQAAFETACASLMRMVSVSYAPTMLVGIRTGGLVVAQAMARAVLEPPPVLPLTCQRPGTATKSRLPYLQEMLATLPRGAVDAMRVL